ncbi:MAG: MFS transporter, partial [Actinomycetota bacterium]|nr:MFS transporter [Actinomycetota bacterium]
YGIGDAFFGPSFGAIIPDLVPQHLLVEANSLGQFVRPLAERLLGPAVGGIVIAAAGEGNEGYAFLFDALTFVVSGACIYAITARKGAPSKERQGSMFSEVAEGLRFVKAHTWLWATLAAASLMLLFWVGPFEVLLPFVIKNNLASGADALGLVFAAGGVGSILVAVVMAQRGLPRRHMVFMYLSFAVAAGAVAGFAFVTTVWQAMIFGFIDGAAVSAGMIVWSTLMHRLVPRALLGRVQSLDWMVSTGLTPLSFALTGPLWKLVGLRATLIGAGALGAVAMLSFMVLPRLYDTEKDERMRIHGASRKPEPQWDHDGEEERDIEHSAKMSG